MTNEERQKIRQALLSAGFKRWEYTHDTGNGVYREIFQHPNTDQVTISWGPRG